MTLCFCSRSSILKKSNLYLYNPNVFPLAHSRKNVIIYSSQIINLSFWGILIHPLTFNSMDNYKHTDFNHASHNCTTESGITFGWG